VLKSIRGATAETASWRSIVLAQQELQANAPGPHVAALRLAANSLQGPARPAALYLVGLADAQMADEASCRDGILNLLRLPAEYSRTQPELAAAGLYHAAAALDKLKDAGSAVAIRHEIAKNYASTEYADRLESESKSGP